MSDNANKIRAFRWWLNIANDGRHCHGARPSITAEDGPYYGIWTVIALEAPASLLAVIVNDCSRWTRSSVVLPFDRVNGIATRKLPPKACEAALWNQLEAAEFTSMESWVVENFCPDLGVI